MRTVNIHATQVELETVAKYLYAAGCESRAMEDAIGYLSLWGLNYPVVDIYLQGPLDGEFTAVYRKRPHEPGDNPEYVIGAVFNKDSRKYGFHS